jgi:FG-GAP-like repeat
MKLAQKIVTVSFLLLGTTLLYCAFISAIEHEDPVIELEMGGVRTLSPHLYPYSYVDSTIGYAFSLTGASGDFNRDGHLDIVIPVIHSVFGDDQEATGIDGELLVAYGNGSGAFTWFDTIHYGDVMTVASSADFDGDENLDVFFYTLSQDKAEVPVAKTTILFGASDGSIRESVEYATPILGVKAIAGDTNADGILDLLLPFLSESGWFSIEVRLGDGSGAFGPPSVYESDKDLLVVPNAVVSADIDADGYLDIISAGRTLDNRPFLVFAYGSASGNFTFVWEERAFDYLPMDMEIGDFNGDGYCDIAIAQPWDTRASWEYFEETGQTSLLPVDDRIVLLLGRGTRSWDEVEIHSGVQCMTLESSDLNGDGILDLVALDRLGNAGVLLGTSSIATSTSQVSTCSFSSPGPPIAVFLGDFSEDGKVDLLAQSGVSELVVRYGDGTGVFGAGWFSPPIDSQVPFGTDLVDTQVDFDQDGHLDLVFFDDRVGVGVVYGDGTGRFEAPSILAEFSNGKVRDVAVGDFDGDGLPDIVVGEAINHQSTGLWLFSGMGGRLFNAARTQIAVLDETVWKFVSGDFNGDVIMDILVIPVLDPAFVFLGNSQNNLLRGPDVPHPFALDSAGLYDPWLGDFNNDGVIDLLATVESDTRLHYVSVLWIGDGFGGFIARNYFPELSIGGLWDFNADGYLDFIGANPNGLGNWIFYSDGMGSFIQEASTLRTFIISDLDGDGHVDGVAGTGYELGVELGDDTGDRVAIAAFANQGHPREQCTLGTSGDFDGDGKLDLATINRGYIAVLLNRLSVAQ